MENKVPIRKSTFHLNYPDDVSWVITSQTSDETKIRLGIKTKDEFQSWLNHYQDKSGFIYRVLRHRKSDGKYSVFKATYRCQHNTVPSHHKAKKPSTKHTNCPAKIEVTIKAVHKRSRGLDAYMPTYPTIVRLIANHNHRSNALETLKHRDVPEPLRNKFLDLFKAGHGPAQALKLHKKDLLLEYGDNYNELLSDRSICPDNKWVYYIYNRHFKKLHIKCSTGIKVVKEIQHEIQRLRSQGIRVAMENTKDQVHYIVLCSPLMDRVHHLETSGDIAFLDGSGNVDRYNCSVFLIMVDSCLGGLPVGAIILSTLNEEMFTAALKSYCNLMPTSAFGGKGEWGPSIFLIDDVKLQENAVKSCFPSSVILFCPSACLQQGWRWFWDPKQNFEPAERREMFRLFTYLFTCTNETEFKQHYDTMITSELVQKHPKFVTYLWELSIKTESWLLCCATNSFTLEDSTNNLTERSVRVLKDKILDKTKSYSILQLVEFLVSDLNTFYKDKILCAKDDCPVSYFCKQYGLHHKELDNFEITKSNDYIYELKNASESYYVMMVGGACECPVGKSIELCCHQQIVAANYDVAATKTLPVDEDSKQHLFWLATGQQQSSSEKTTVELVNEKETSAEENTVNTTENLNNDNEPDLTENYPRSEIERIGNEFIKNVLKHYSCNPKSMVQAMRKFEKCFLQRCSTENGTLRFLNYVSSDELLSDENVNKMVTAEHDYSHHAL